MRKSDSGRVGLGAVEVAYSGRGTGEPVILLHGGEGAGSQFDVFRPLLGEGVRTIAYDQRDTGDSRNPESPYGMDDLARDCAGLIRGLGYERAHIFGSSYGGALALQIAVTVPEVVQTLTVGATVAKFAGATQTATRTLSARTVEERDRMMIDNLLSEQAQRSPEQVAECTAVLIQRTPEQHARRMEALFNFDVADRLASIDAPTLLVYGSDDPLTPVANGYVIAEAIPGARLEVLPDIRHGLTLEAKHRTAALLRDFVLAHPLGEAVGCNEERTS